ncbi:hypothetical protein DCAR_0414934 [Daucus carota subsp. sativus]|uniref:Reverse transcriptase zinc-binding domain-containing protein n=1 Tax=Daucus carota subsp. sativus TaxID=79200 RepID=A0AAF1AUN4_DAUCS|nr:hypothetical protein DCAR_0414934 [Daucus carota subsp. sativus]
MFEEASGQQVNLSKSSVIFSSNVDRESRETVCNVLHMQEAGDDVTYIGLPNMIGMNKLKVLGFLKDRMNNKVQSWKESWISQAGKAILIKNVAQAVPNYAMSTFLLPLEITRDFERSLSKYWWEILNQPWLNNVSNAFVTTEVQGLDNATVDQLMVTEGGQWDIDIVEDLLNVKDKQCILNTMVGGDREEDVLYWNEDLSGDYTVKSAYQMLQRQKGLWSTADNSNLWKVIWSIKAPPKVLNMVWRALSNSLPTREVLAEKRVPLTLICPFCTGNGESILHVLVQCPFADQCWRKRGRGYQPLAEVSFDRWLQSTKTLYRDVNIRDGVCSWAKPN